MHIFEVISSVTIMVFKIIYIKKNTSFQRWASMIFKCKKWNGDRECSEGDNGGGGWTNKLSQEFFYKVALAQ